MDSGKTVTGVEDQVLVEEKSFARILALNRPRQLNALSFQMVSQLLDRFTAYEDDPSVKLVIVKGKGRAFCAGGDVAAVVHFANEGHWRLGAKFFHREFRLCYIMSTYKKPQVSLLDGIVMGGGAGVSIHGRFRVATENSVFAMPETALGLFPDIGASYFLSRLPGFLGEYCGLTGARLNGAEMLSCGLATHFVSSKRLPLLEEALCEVDVEPGSVSSVINKFSEQVPLKQKSALCRMDIIDKCFSKRTIEEIVSALEQEVASGADDWVAAALQSMKKASPMSLKITLRSIREGRLQSVDKCLVQEFRMVCHILRRDISKDFFEGCRAILLDKDRNPKWEPSSLDMISDEMVDRHFSKLDEDDWEDLKLPLKHNGARSGATSKL